MLIFIWILSVQGGINHIFLDEQFDVENNPDRLTGELHTKTEIRNGTRFQLSFLSGLNFEGRVFFIFYHL
jgi:hypothetical protein